MRKNVIVTVMLVITMVLSACANTDLAYSAGPDTYRLYGDGTFQILKESRESLFTMKYNSCLIEEVTKRLEIEDTIYLTGINNDRYGIPPNKHADVQYQIYAIIDIPNNSIRICCEPEESPYAKDMYYIYRIDEMIENGDLVIEESFADFSEEERAIFEDMS